MFELLSRFEARETLGRESGVVFFQTTYRYNNTKKPYKPVHISNLLYIMKIHLFAKLKLMRYKGERAINGSIFHVIESRVSGTAVEVMVEQNP